MSEERDFQRNVLLILLLAPVAFVGWWFLRIVHGVAMEGQRSQIHGAFSIAAERAIQLDRYGRTFAEATNDIPHYNGERFSNDPTLVTCEVRPRPFPNDDPSKKIAYSLIESRRPLRIYLIYTGPSPDFSTVFNNPDGRKYFAAQTTQYNGEPAELFLNTQDYRSDFDNYIAGRRFQWESHECTDFSYTIVRES